MEITKQKALIWQIAKYRVAFEMSYSYYALQPLTAWLPKLASRLERLNYSHWFYSE